MQPHSGSATERLNGASCNSANSLKITRELNKEKDKSCDVIKKKLTQVSVEKGS